MNLSMPLRFKEMTIIRYYYYFKRNICMYENNKIKATPLLLKNISTVVHPLDQCCVLISLFSEFPL